MALKVRALNSDGSEESAEFELPITDPDTGELLADVVITCRPVSPHDLRQLRRKHTHPRRNPATRQMEPELDDQAFQDAVIDMGIVRWRGIVGADGKDLVCTTDTKPYLDVRVQAQVYTAVCGSEVTDRQASFRQPA